VIDCGQTQQPQQPADDGDTLTLKLISEGHARFCAVMSDRLHCLTSVKQVLSGGNFKVIVCLSVLLSISLSIYLSFSVVSA